MKLAIDCDDVLVNFWPRVIECYNMEFGEHVEEAAQNDWGDNPIKMSPHFGEGKMFSDWWQWWESRATLWSDCDAIDGAIGGLYNLHAQGHYLQLVTSKPLWSRKWFFKWLTAWNPYFDELIIVEEGTGAQKQDVTDADILIDDKPSNITGWVETGRTAICFSRPWNAEADFSYYDSRIFRTHDWAGVLSAIKVIDLRSTAKVVPLGQ